MENKQTEENQLEEIMTSGISELNNGLGTITEKSYQKLTNTQLPSWGKIGFTTVDIGLGILENSRDSENIEETLLNTAIDLTGPKEILDTIHMASQIGENMSLKTLNNMTGSHLDENSSYENIINAEYKLMDSLNYCSGGNTVFSPDFSAGNTALVFKATKEITGELQKLCKKTVHWLCTEETTEENLSEKMTNFEKKRSYVGKNELGQKFYEEGDGSEYERIKNLTFESKNNNENKTFSFTKDDSLKLMHHNIKNMENGSSEYNFNNQFVNNCLTKNNEKNNYSFFNHNQKNSDYLEINNNFSKTNFALNENVTESFRKKYKDEIKFDISNSFFKNQDDELIKKSFYSNINYSNIKKN